MYVRLSEVKLLQKGGESTIAFKAPIQSDGITMASFCKDAADRHNESKQRSKERWNEMATIQLDSDFDFAGLLASSRKRGIYEPVVKEFYGSGDVGAQVDTTEGEFLGKKVPALMAGFKNAIEKLELSQAIRVVAQDGNVYLINQELV